MGSCIYETSKNIALCTVSYLRTIVGKARYQYGDFDSDIGKKRVEECKVAGVILEFRIIWEVPCLFNGLWGWGEFERVS